MGTLLVGTILGKVIGTLILVFVIGTVMGIFTYLRDKKEQYGMQNFWFSYIIVGVVALLIWLINIGIYLLS